MEKLTEAQRKNIEKMSDTRVINVLTRAVFMAEKLESMDRQARLAASAEITLASEKFKPAAEAGGGTPTFGYDPEFERMKYEWAKQKWAAQRGETGKGGGAKAVAGKVSG